MRPEPPRGPPTSAARTATRETEQAIDATTEAARDATTTADEPPR
jgi:hypothetical protein